MFDFSIFFFGFHTLNTSFEVLLVDTKRLWTCRLRLEYRLYRLYRLYRDYIGKDTNKFCGFEVDNKCILYMNSQLWYMIGQVYRPTLTIMPHQKPCPMCDNGEPIASPMPLKTDVEIPMTINVPPRLCECCDRYVSARTVSRLATVCRVM